MALATSLSTEKMSVSLRSNVSAQRWESLAALISWTFTRTTSPLFCTLPSTMWATPSSLAISGRRSEEHTSELQSHHDLVCRLLLEKKKNKKKKDKTTNKK